MSNIRLSRKHGLDAVEARARVGELAETLNQKYGADCRWQGDCLHLKRAGATGTIDIGTQGQVMVNVKLGLPLRPLKAAIENSILNGFDKFLDPVDAS